MTVMDAADPARGEPLPRSRAGSSPQHLLLTLIGDFWFSETTDVDSAALVALLAEFEVPESAARAALSRLARRGLLESGRVGRSTRYRLTPYSHEVLVDGLRQIEALTRPPEPWDGQWTVASFSVPESQRDLRSSLRRRLGWLGFAPLLDAQWVSPRADPMDVVNLYRKLELTSGSVHRGRWHPESPLMPVDAWDLEQIRLEYEQFIQRYADLSRQVERHAVDQTAALVARARLMDDWRRFPDWDPQLPQEVLPPRWPRAEAQAQFLRLYEALGAFAVRRARDVVGAIDSSAAERIQHHSFVESR